MKNLLINPFTKIAGFPSLIWGLSIIILSAFLASFNNIHFDGVLDIHLGLDAKWYYFILEVVIDWLCISILFYIMSIALSKSSIRIIDIFGTQALARFPYLLVSLVGFLPYLKDLSIGTLPFILFAIFSVLILIWYLVLAFNALKIAANLQGSKLIISFISGVILAEIASKYLIYIVYNL